MENNKLTNDIITVLARFDLFNFPLTALEIWQFLPNKYSFLEVINRLNNLTYLEMNNGFYFLPTRSELIKIRQERYRFSQVKIKILKKRLKFIIWLPGLKLICLANIIGPNNLKPETDFDLFIVTKNNYLWFVKLSASLILKLTHLRPTKKNTKNKLCLSFLIDESALNLSAFKLNQDDWYFTYWLAGLMPIWGQNKTWENLIKNNSWLKTSLPNWQESVILEQKNFCFKKSKITKNSKNILEPIAKKLHQLMMVKKLKNNQNQTTSVVITDHVLKLHTTDRRADFIKLAKEKIQQLC